MTASEVGNWIVNRYYQDKVNWDVAFGAIILMVAYALLHPYLRWNKRTWAERRAFLSWVPRRRGRAMRKARRDFIRSDTIDALVDHIEKRVAQGDYTRKEAKELYREARKAWHVKDLFPNPDLLKEDIKRRLALHQNDPVPLPGKVVRKHLFDKPAKA